MPRLLKKPALIKHERDYQPYNQQQAQQTHNNEFVDAPPQIDVSFKISLTLILEDFKEKSSCFKSTLFKW